MGIFQTFYDWQAQMYQKKVEKMRDQGLCPDCRGRGYNPAAVNAYVYMPTYDYTCAGCNGTGSFSDWNSREL